MNRGLTLKLALFAGFAMGLVGDAEGQISCRSGRWAQRFVPRTVRQNRCCTSVNVISNCCRTSRITWRNRSGYPPIQRNDCCVTMVCPCANSDQMANDAKSVEPPKYIVRFAGELPQDWIRTNYGGQGSVEVQNKVITMDIGQGLTGIHWNTKNFPKDNFEFVVRARRITGEDMTCGLTFPVGDQFASLIVGGWGGSVVGISCIDDKAADENETTSDMQLKHRQWYTIHVRVADNKLVCFVDGKKVVDISTKGRKFSLRGDCESSQPFAVFSFGTYIEVDRLEIVDLSEKRSEK